MFSLCQEYDVIFVQEHWLYPEDLSCLDRINTDFICIATSSMSSSICSNVRFGRPFGGLGVLVRKSLLVNFKSMARHDRCIAICIGSVLMINVYLPVRSGADYVDVMTGVCSDIMSVTQECQFSNVLIGDDFNFNYM